MTKTLAILAVAGLASTVLAQGGLNKDYSIAHDPALVLPTVGVVNSTITVTDTNLIASMDYVFIDISHTWSNDLTITLTHNNNVVRLIDRPATGSRDLALGQIYRFQANGVAFGSVAGTVIPGLPNVYAPVDPLANFVGKQKFGDWTLTVTDTIGGDGGFLRAWGFGVRNVPTPGAFALLGLGGLAAARRRRA